MRRTILLGSGLASSVLYVATDILGALRYPEYSYRDQWFSELTAQGSPVRSLMVVLNVIPYTALVSALALGIWQSPHQTRATRITAAGLAGYAVFGMAGGLVFPMKPREALAAGEGTLRNTMHIPATMLMSICIMLAMGAGAALLGRRFRHYSYGTIAALITFGMLTSLQADAIDANDPTPWAGIEERVNIYATMLWLAVLVVGLMKTEGSAVLEPRTRQRRAQLGEQVAAH